MNVHTLMDCRIGASGLLLDIERQLFHWVTGRYKTNHYQFPDQHHFEFTIGILPSIVPAQTYFSFLSLTLKCAPKVRCRPRACHVVNQISFLEWSLYWKEGAAQTEDCCNSAASYAAINLFIKVMLFSIWQR